MARTFLIVVLVSTLFGAASLAQEPNKALSPTENAGRKIFASRCAMCHVGADPAVEVAGDTGVRRRGTMGPVLSKAHVANVERFREKVLNGGARMPGYKLALGDEQINQVIAYMQTVDAPLTRLAAAHPGE